MNIDLQHLAAAANADRRTPCAETGGDESVQAALMQITPIELEQTPRDPMVRCHLPAVGMTGQENVYTRLGRLI